MVFDLLFATNTLTRSFGILRTIGSQRIHEYNVALSEYYNKAGKNAEPPEYIIDMIEIVKGKMK
mgnify:CR=1 FL=1